MKPVVYTKVPPVDRELVARAASHGIADLHEGLGMSGGRMTLMSPRMRPLCPGRHIAGRAVTAYNYPGDNLMMHKALQLAEPGDVLVLTNGGGTQGALWGELASTYAQRKGLAGVIVDGSIRDTGTLAAMDFPVWFTSISVCHPEKRSAGAVNVPVVCDGVLVNPGDTVVADADGVIVIPRAYVKMAVENAQARKRKEEETRRAIANGATLIQLFDGDAVLRSLGVDIREKTWLEDAQQAG